MNIPCYDLVGTYDLYLDKVDGGDYIRVDDLADATAYIVVGTVDYAESIRPRKVYLNEKDAQDEADACNAAGTVCKFRVYSVGFAT